MPTAGTKGERTAICYELCNSDTPIHCRLRGDWVFSGVMLAWEAGPASSVHDVNMLISTTVAAKAVILGPGAGYMSNIWWPATMSYQPSAATAAPGMSSGGRWPRDLRREGEAAARLTPGGSASLLRPATAVAPADSAEKAAVVPCPPSLTPIGVLMGSAGPMWQIGVNLEHSSTLEVGLVTGSVNHMIVGLQTEEAPVALSLNSTKNTVVWGAVRSLVHHSRVRAEAHNMKSWLTKACSSLQLLPFWNASQTSLAPAVAFRPNPSDSDLSYRLYGLGVPVSASDSALLIDSGQYELAAAGQGFSMATAVLN